MMAAILTGNPRAILAGLALITAGAALAVWHLYRQHRAATWEAREWAARQQVKHRHPAYQAQQRRCAEDTTLIPRYADATMLIPRQRDGRR